jgi:hypothetical protein
MKNFSRLLVVGFFSLLALTSCLGDTEDIILGKWQYVEVHPKSTPPITLEFKENNRLEVIDILTGDTFQGRYRLTPDLDHRYVEIFNLDDLYAHYDSLFIDYGKNEGGTRDLRAIHVITRLTADVLILTNNRFSPNSDRAIQQWDFVRAQ